MEIVEAEPGHLTLNRSSDQLSPRTPPAIFNSDIRANASLALSPSIRANSQPRGHKFSRIMGLPPLVLSCLSFSQSLSLFSIICSLFLQNTGGGV